MYSYISATVMLVVLLVDSGSRGGGPRSNRSVVGGGSCDAK